MGTKTQQTGTVYFTPKPGDTTAFIRRFDTDSDNTVSGPVALDRLTKTGERSMVNYCDDY